MQGEGVTSRDFGCSQRAAKTRAPTACHSLRSNHFPRAKKWHSNMFCLVYCILFIIFDAMFTSKETSHSILDFWILSMVFERPAVTHHTWRVGALYMDCVLLGFHGPHPSLHSGAPVLIPECFHKLVYWSFLDPLDIWVCNPSSEAITERTNSHDIFGNRGMNLKILTLENFTCSRLRNF